MLHLFIVQQIFIENLLSTKHYTRWYWDSGGELPKRTLTLQELCCTVVSDCLQPNELQHARLPCLSLSPGVCSDSCPLSQWCHPTISSFAAPSPLALKLSQHQGLSQWAGSLHQVANSIAQFLDPKPASGISLGKTMESSLSGFSQWVWGTPLPPSITYSVGLEWSTWHLNDPVLN